jgi:hypothetical protein
MAYTRTLAAFLVTALLGFGIVFLFQPAELTLPIAYVVIFTMASFISDTRRLITNRRD